LVLYKKGRINMGRKRRSAEEKARIALEALREDKPLRAIAEKYGVHPNQISDWKRQLLENAGDIFRHGKGSKEKELESQNEMVLRELGQSQVEIAFLKKKLRQLGIPE
jgi:transposase-like protein